MSIASERPAGLVMTADAALTSPVHPLEPLIERAAPELAPHGITINSVMPGHISTEGLADSGQEYLDKMSAAIPMGTLASPEDIGAAMADRRCPKADF